MFFPFRAFGDPALEGIYLLRRKSFAGFERRHAVVFVLGRDTRDQGTLVRFAGDDGVVAGFQFGESAVLLVEAQAGFAFVGIGAVAGVAVVGKDGADVAVEINLCRAIERFGAEHSNRREAKKSHEQ